MRRQFAATATRLLDEDPRTAVVLADISAVRFTVAWARHPTRVINVGIREQLMIGVAGGLALTGMRPIVHTYAPFLVSRPFEQIKLDLAHQDVGAVLVSIGASYDLSGCGLTHHGPEDVALLDTQNDWDVYVPGHRAEVEPVLRAAVRGNGRVYVRLSERTNRMAFRPEAGRMEVVRRGQRGTVIAVGPMLDPCLDAVGDLDVNLLYATTVRPFDVTTLRSTLTTPDVVLVEPYLAGTSARPVDQALTDVPHRLLLLGVGCQDVRSYGTVEDHDRLHGLDARSLRQRMEAFLR
ncbi:transketolase family protein [Streptomyces sp. NPDC056987]|uniref:transketolase family protein n=1 Tax=Streptomyces sp. NPDC056987 TaxID=3345988 RepID=UPI003629D052